MSYYRRANAQGASYFFIVVSYRCQHILCDEPVRYALREAILETRLKYPFSIDAWVLLPDHLHCIWSLPEGDRDFSKRWCLIKRSVSLSCANNYKKQKWLNDSKKKHRESTLWQRRFWEHQIRDQQDFNRHVDYIHYNPVKHGLCERADIWLYSTLHRYMKNGSYPQGWAMSPQNDDNISFGE